MAKKKQNRKQTLNKSKSSSKKISSKKSSLKVDPYDPRQVLSGKLLKKFVRSQVRQSVRPQIKAAERQASELQNFLDRQIQQQSQLGQQASQNIGGYYADLNKQDQAAVARSQALAARLSGDVGAANTQGAEAVGKAADTSLANLSADEQLRQQAPSAARDELQAMIVAQKGRQATEGQALAGTAASRGSDWTQAMGMLQGANRMTGASTLSDVNKTTQNRIADLQSEYGPDIRDARASERELRSSKGDLRREILGELRGQEREFLLSKGALGIDRQELESANVQAQFDRKQAKKGKAGVSGQIKLAKQYGKNKKKEQARSLRNQLQVARLHGDLKKAEQIRGKLSQLKVIAAQGGGKSGKLAEYDKPDKQRAIEYVKSAGDIDFLKKNKSKVITEMNRRYGVNPVLGRWAIKQILAREKKHSKKVRKTFGQGIW